MQFFNYVMRKGAELNFKYLHTLDSLSLLKLMVFSHPVWLHQTRIGLSLYDVAGQGYLRESVSAAPSFQEMVLLRLQV